MRTFSAFSRYGTFGLLFLAACSGNLTCTACNLDPIPGGFDQSNYIRRSAQVRIAASGLDFIESEFSNLVQAYAPMQCGGVSDLPCPTAFNGPISCGTTDGVCVDTASQTPLPLLGFAIDRSQSSGATVCRDAINDPNRRECNVWLQLEGLDLQTVTPNRVEATVTAQVLSTDIPIEYNPNALLDADCLLKLDSRGGTAALPQFTLTIEARPYPNGNQLEVTVTDVALNLADEDVTLVADPNQTYADPIELGCSLGNLPAVKNALIPLFAGSFTDTIDAQIRRMFGRICGAGYPPCPQGTCNAGFCEDANGKIIPTRVAVEGRLDLGGLLGGLSLSTVEPSDLGFFLGGDAATDATGIQVGMMAGFEATTLNTDCARAEPSPRNDTNRPLPSLLPAEDQVDLDFDGTPETPYMVALSLSDLFTDQVLWSAYTTGAICLGLSTYDEAQLNSGTLGLLVPSLSQLTHSDRYPWSVWPIRVLIRADSVPSATVGTGETMSDGTVVDPLLRLNLDNTTLDFLAVVEDRWVQIMTVSADLTVPFGAFVNPNNEVELVTGDLANAFTNVRVSNNRLLGETAAQIESALPGLLSVFLPELSGSYLDPIALPDPSSLGGFGLDVLGIRGVEGDNSSYEHVGVYANLSFDPSLALRIAAKTEAELLEVSVPPIELWPAQAGASAERPAVTLGLAERDPSGRRLEHQVRVGDGLWSPFFQGSQKRIEPPALLIQGQHRIEVRSRIVGDYRSLDPSPVVFDVVIDPEAPRLVARLFAGRGGAEISAWDVVSQDRVRYELAVDGVWREVRPDSNGFVVIPELERANAAVAVAAIDEQGNRAEQILRAGYALESEADSSAASGESSGCACVSSTQSTSSLSLLSLLGLLALVRRRRS